MATLQEVFDELDLQIDADLMALAFIHRSYSYENGGIPTNERLEFLGDSVLSVVVTEYLYLQYPKKPEGQLARLRSAVVNTLALADVARELGLGGLVRLGRGEENTGGNDKDSILADTMEAVIGAVFLSEGRDGAWKFVRRLFISRVFEAVKMGAGLDWKSSLQEICATQGWEMPTYTFEVSGPEHDRRFVAHCHIAGKIFGPGDGRSKKQAEQQAAGLAYATFSPDED